VTPVTVRDQRTVAVAALLVASLGGCTFGESTGDTVAASGGPEGDGLRLDIALTDADPPPGAPIPVRVSVRNDAAVPLPLLPRNTALEEPLQADVFRVRLEGQPRPYLGIIAQRLPVTAADVVTLDPGESLERTLDLAAHYRMDRSGTYEVRYAPRALTIDPGLGITLPPIKPGTDTFSITVR